MARGKIFVAGNTAWASISKLGRFLRLVYAITLVGVRLFVFRVRGPSSSLGILVVSGAGAARPQRPR